MDRSTIIAILHTLNQVVLPIAEKYVEAEKNENLEIAFRFTKGGIQGVLNYYNGTPLENKKKEVLNG